MKKENWQRKYMMTYKGTVNILIGVLISQDRSTNLNASLRKEGSCTQNPLSDRLGNQGSSLCLHDLVLLASKGYDILNGIISSSNGFEKGQRKGSHGTDRSSKPREHFVPMNLTTASSVLLFQPNERQVDSFTIPKVSTFSVQEVIQNTPLLGPK